MIKKIILWTALAGLFIFISYRQTHKDYYDYIIMSGATPIAVAKRVPSAVSLSIEGMVKTNYKLSGDALNALATTRIRTREMSPEGEFQGAYIYLGIPVFNILEGISPQKPETYAFDSPLDILVTFVSASGETSHFSFNEMIMTDDRYPVTLAYDRKEVLPTREEDRIDYNKNIYKGDIEGLKLICPREPDTKRYLDNVVRIVYSVVPVDEEKLPSRKKKYRCTSTGITCMTGDTVYPGNFSGVTRKDVPNWIRIGHGHGFDDVAHAAGFDLRSFLTENFSGASPDDFFLFVACDGYRALFSGREIFLTEDGAHMMIMDHLNNETPPEGYMLAPTKDYFSDRAMWGVSFVARIGQNQLEL